MSNLSKSDGESTLYIKAIDENILIVALYVDDLIFTRDLMIVLFLISSKL